MVVKEEHVGFDAVGVENAGGQAQNGVEIGGLQQLLADGFACATFKQYVVGEDDGGLAGGFEQGANVLNEVELLVGGGGEKVLTVVGEVFFFFFAVGVGNGRGAFFAEGWVGEHVVISFAAVGDRAHRC